MIDTRNNLLKIPPINISGDETLVWKRNRDFLIGPDGQSYKKFRSSLTPHWRQIWLEIGLSWGTIIGIFCAVGLISGVDLPMIWRLCVSFGGAALIGFFIAFLSLWFHEASHFNILPVRRMNDLTANVIMGWLLLQDIKGYRKVHLQHHKHLGTTEDPEHSYFSHLDLGFIFRSLTGISVLRVLAIRMNVIKELSTERANGNRYASFVMLAGCILHAAIVGGAYWVWGWMPALTWLLGALSIYPLFSAVRQLLEHRRYEAKKHADYTVVDHGAYSRVFTPGPFASVFGGAGFNRHLLHHWDMGVSCTRLAEMEKFIETGQLGNYYRSRRTSYVGTFLNLTHH